jgi:hypothetical protein
MPAYANGSPKENNHVRHAQVLGIGCEICHADTTADGLTIVNPGVHVNGRYTLRASGSYGGEIVTFNYTVARINVEGACSGVNSACHGTVGSDQTWGGP